MIDVTFLLLIYFLYVMVVAADEDRLSPLLQTKSDAADVGSEFQTQTVEVLPLDGVPSYRLGRRVFLDRESLLAALDELPRDLGLLIEVSGGVPVGFAVSAVQAARDAGFEQVTYVPES